MWKKKGVYNMTLAGSPRKKSQQTMSTEHNINSMWRQGQEAGDDSETEESSLSTTHMKECDAAEFLAGVYVHKEADLTIDNNMAVS